MPDEQYGESSIRPPRPALRASDDDRERVAAAVRQHCVDGRLTVTEMSDRVAQAYAARTFDELGQVTADLPALEAYPLPVPADRSMSTGRDAAMPYQRGWPERRDRADRRPSRRDHSVRGQLAAWISVSIICWAVWLAQVLATGHVNGVWPIWTLVWGAWILARAVRALPHSDR